MYIYHKVWKTMLVKCQYGSDCPQQIYIDHVKVCWIKNRR